MTSPLLRMQARPAPASAFSSVLTLAWRAMLKIKHVPFQLFDVTITPIMFTLLFTYIFGGALGGTPRAYIQFTGFSLGTPSLDDVFFALTGHAAEQPAKEEGKEHAA